MLYVTKCRTSAHENTTETSETGPGRTEALISRRVSMCVASQVRASWRTCRGPERGTLLSPMPTKASSSCQGGPSRRLAGCRGGRERAERRQAMAPSPAGVCAARYETASLGMTVCQAFEVTYAAERRLASISEAYFLPVMSTVGYIFGYTSLGPRRRPCGGRPVTNLGDRAPLAAKLTPPPVGAANVREDQLAQAARPPEVRLPLVRAPAGGREPGAAGAGRRSGTPGTGSTP